jgi:hypothetical protein
MNLSKICFFVILSFLFFNCSVTKVSLLEKDLRIVKRDANLYLENGRNAIELDAKESDGLGIIQTESFKSGTIEIDIKGENNPGKSFVGFAFNIVDDETYEAVYFRPFNFVATEQIRKEHMVQYIYHPEYPWHKLRSERTGEFEAEISAPPDPDDWFTAIIKVTPDRVMAFLKDRSDPILNVPRLTATTSDKIGVWVGFGSSGRFDNLKVKQD